MTQQEILLAIQEARNEIARAKLSLGRAESLFMAAARTMAQELSKAEQGGYGVVNETEKEAFK